MGGMLMDYMKEIKGDFGRTDNNPLASFTPESVENLRKST